MDEQGRKVAWNISDKTCTLETPCQEIPPPEEGFHNHTGIKQYLIKESIHLSTGIIKVPSNDSNITKKPVKEERKNSTASQTYRRFRRKFGKCMEIFLHLSCIAYFYFTVENCRKILKRLQICFKKYSKKSKQFNEEQKQTNISNEEDALADTLKTVKVLELYNPQQFWSLKDVQDEKDSNEYKGKLSALVHEWQKAKDPLIWTELLAELEHLLVYNMTERLQVYISVIVENDLQSEPALQKKVLDNVYFLVHQSKIELTSLLKTEELISNQMGIDILSTVMMNKELDVLHMAILNKNCDLLLHILNKLDDIGRHRLVNRPAKASLMKNIGTITELPLNLAVCGGQLKIIRMLVQNGAEMCVQDSQGYNCFHVVCLMAKEREEKHTCSLFTELMRLIPVWINNTKICPSLKHMSASVQECLAYNILFKGTSCSKTSPLLMAVGSGSIELMTKILTLKNVYQMACAQSNVNSKTNYDITEIDSLMCGRNSRPSTMEVLAFSQSDHTLKCFSHPLIKALNEKKNKYYNVYIAFAAIIHISIMLIFSGGTYEDVLPYLVTNSTEELQAKRYQIQAVDWFMAFVSVLYTIYVTKCAKVIHKIASRCHLSTIDEFWSYNTLQLQTMVLFCIALWFYIFLKMIHDPNESLALSMSMLVGWMHCIAYTRPMRSTGFFTIMINRILFSDIIRFLFVIAIFALAFTMAALVLFSTEYDITKANNYIYSNPLYIMFDFTRLAAGIADYTNLILNQHFMMSVLIYLVFVIFCNILLFTLLVAAMNTTYAAIAQLDDLHWHRVRLADIITLERIVPKIIKKQLLRHFTCQLIRVNVDKDTQFEFMQYLFEAPATKCDQTSSFGK